MKKYFPFIILVVLIAVNMGCKTGKEAVALKLNLPKGSQYDYSMNIKMNMEEKVMGRDVKVQSTMAFAYIFEVTDIDPTWKTVSSTISKFSMDVNSMGQNVHIDTDNDGDTSGPMGMASKVFRALKGAKYSFTVNDNGEIGEIKGLKEMQEKLLAGLPNSEEILKSMNGSFDDETIRQNMQQVFAAYPGKPVKPGDTWSRSVTQNAQGMKVSFDNHYSLEAVNGNDAIVKVISSLSSPDNSAMNGTKVNMSGSSEGKMHYDMTTGMPTNSNLDMKMKMNVYANGTEIPVDMDIVTTTTGKKM